MTCPTVKTFDPCTVPERGCLNFKTIQLIISHSNFVFRGLDLLASLQQLGRHLLLKFLIELYDLQPGFVHSIGSRRQIKPRQIMILKLAQLKMHTKANNRAFK
jgi:hypothetical protein